MESLNAKLNPRYGCGRSFSGSLAAWRPRLPFEDLSFVGFGVYDLGFIEFRGLGFIGFRVYRV